MLGSRSPFFSGLYSNVWFLDKKMYDYLVFILPVHEARQCLNTLLCNCDCSPLLSILRRYTATKIVFRIRNEARAPFSEQKPKTPRLCWLVTEI